MNSKHSIWAIRNAFHTITWSDGISKIDIKLSSDWLDIFYIPGQSDFNIRVFVELKTHEVKFADLLGNGSGSKYQCKYIGTLLVNLAIQMLRLIYSDRLESVIVTGETCPDRSCSDSNYDEDIARRAHFWKRFGFHLEKPLDAKSPFKATLANLTLVDRGIVNNINTMLCVDAFWRTYHQPTLFKEDMEVLQQIDTENYHSIKHAKSRKDIRSAQDKLDKYRLNGVFFVFLCIYLAQLYVFSDLHPKWIIAIAAIFYGTSAYVTHRYKEEINKLFPLFYEIKKWEQLQSDAKSHWQVIVDEEIKRPGLFHRFYQSLLNSGSLEEKKLLDESSRHIQFSSEDRKDLAIEWYNLIAKYKTQFQLLNRTRVTRSDSIDDFLFGKIHDGGMSISSFNEHALQLENQFENHLNRLVKQLPNHRLCVTGGSFSEPEGLNHIEDIARVELYVNGTIYCDYVRIHFRVFIVKGIVDFRCDWSAYSETRRRESLLALSQLIKKKLLTKMYIVDGQNVIKAPDEIDSLIYSFLDMGKCFSITPEELQAYRNLLQRDSHPSTTQDIPFQKVV